MNWTDKIQVFREDCKEVMKRYPDNYFDLAIVDPPYGINVAKNGVLHNNSKYDRGFKKSVNYGEVKWDDSIPNRQYFEELKRVSKKQIIWGGNFFLDYLGATRCVIVWNKKGKDKNPNFSPFEMAWTNINTLPKLYDYPWIGFGYINSGEKKIHPTQKPVSLYRRLLSDFAETGDKILDTHLGSGSIALACHELGFKLTASEISEDIYNSSFKRFQNESKFSLFS